MFSDANGDLEEAGVFCRAYVLFPTKHRQASVRAQNMVTEIYRNFKKLSQDAKCHDCLENHEDAAENMRRFLTTSFDPKQRIDFNISCRSQRRIEKNRSILLSILRCLEFAGRQGLALRGHRDDLSSTESEPQGNFLAVTGLP